MVAELRPLVDVPPWIDPDYAKKVGDCFQNADDDAMLEAIQVSSNVLHSLTAGIFTVPIEILVRPPFGAFPKQPWLDRYVGSFGFSQQWGTAGAWLRTPRAPWDNSLERGYTPMILLGGYPVISIEQVLVDTEEISAYTVEDYRYLLRTDGHGWPLWQDMTKDPLVDKDTFQVDFTFGSGIPTDGKWACRVLACEYYKYSHDGKTRLPQRTTAVNRQGISVTVLDPQDFLDAGRTGIPEVDLFIKRVNPNALRSRAQVFTPDMVKPVRSTTFVGQPPP